MNQNALFRLVARLLVFAAAVCGERLVNAQSPSGENVSAATLTVMTYNLKFASTNPPNAWSTRRPLMREAIRQIAPDVFGTQEGLYEQLKDIAADLPDYDWIGLGRKGEGLNSSNGFKAIRRNGVRIDWILTRGEFTVDSAEIVTFSRDGQFPSDHFPVVTRLRMGAAK